MYSFFLLNLFSSIGKIEKPNIIIIMADDLGWNDVGWNNHDIKTPNLNTLAYEGIILNSSYVSPLCSPSRAALLTGYYPFKMGLQNGVIKRDKPQGIPLNYTLLPQRLKDLGYSTYMIGKWHLGYCKWEYTPTYRGFDKFIGFYQGSQDYYTHSRGKGKKKGYDFRYNTKPFYPKKFRYSSIEYAQYARDTIKYHKKDKPLFLYLSFQGVHLPNEVPKRYEYTYSHIKNKNRRLFSAMVTALDNAVGEVMRALYKKKMLDNTLIVFLSDNGGAPLQGASNWPLRGGKASLYEGGTRVPSVVWGKMLNKTGYVNKNMVHITDWFPTLIEAAGGTPDPKLDGISQWNMLANGAESNKTEFVYAINENNNRAAIRYGKYKLIEGYPGHYTDWYKPPKPDKKRNNLTLKKYKKKKQLKAELFHKYHNKVSLYDIERDPIELHDISAKHPDIVKLLRGKLSEYRKELKPAHNPKSVKKALPKFWKGIYSPGWC